MPYAVKKVLDDPEMPEPARRAGISEARRAYWALDLRTLSTPLPLLLLLLLNLLLLLLLLRLLLLLLTVEGFDKKSGS